jgi:hypothetical protein
MYLSKNNEIGVEDICILIFFAKLFTIAKKW